MSAAQTLCFEYRLLQAKSIGVS